MNKTKWGFKTDGVFVNEKGGEIDHLEQEEPEYSWKQEEKYHRETEKESLPPGPLGETQPEPLVSPGSVKTETGRVGRGEIQEGEGQEWVGVEGQTVHSFSL